MAMTQYDNQQLQVALGLLVGADQVGGVDGAVGTRTMNAAKAFLADPRYSQYVSAYAPGVTADSLTRNQLELVFEAARVAVLENTGIADDMLGLAERVANGERLTPAETTALQGFISLNDITEKGADIAIDGRQGGQTARLSEQLIEERNALSFTLGNQPLTEAQIKLLQGGVNLLLPADRQVEITGQWNPQTAAALQAALTAGGLTDVAAANGENALRAIQGLVQRSDQAAAMLDSLAGVNPPTNLTKNQIMTIQASLALHGEFTRVDGLLGSHTILNAKQIVANRPTPAPVEGVERGPELPPLETDTLVTVDNNGDDGEGGEESDADGEPVTVITAPEPVPAATRTDIAEGFMDTLDGRDTIMVSQLLGSYEAFVNKDNRFTGTEVFYNRGETYSQNLTPGGDVQLDLRTREGYLEALKYVYAYANGADSAADVDGMFTADHAKLEAVRDGHFAAIAAAVEAISRGEEPPPPPTSLETLEINRNAFEKAVAQAGNDGVIEASQFLLHYEIERTGSMMGDTIAQRLGVEPGEEIDLKTPEGYQRALVLAYMDSHTMSAGDALPEVLAAATSTLAETGAAEIKSHITVTTQPAIIPDDAAMRAGISAAVADMLSGTPRLDLVMPNVVDTNKLVTALAGLEDGNTFGNALQAYGIQGNASLIRTMWESGVYPDPADHEKFLTVPVDLNNPDHLTYIYQTIWMAQNPGLTLDRMYTGDLDAFRTAWANRPEDVPVPVIAAPLPEPVPLKEINGDRAVAALAGPQDGQPFTYEWALQTYAGAGVTVPDDGRNLKVQLLLTGNLDPSNTAQMDRLAMALWFYENPQILDAATRQNRPTNMDDMPENWKPESVVAHITGLAPEPLPETATFGIGRENRVDPASLANALLASAGPEGKMSFADAAIVMYGLTTDTVEVPQSERDAVQSWLSAAFGGEGQELNLTSADGIHDALTMLAAYNLNKNYEDLPAGWSDQLRAIAVTVAGEQAEKTAQAAADTAARELMTRAGDDLERLYLPPENADGSLPPRTEPFFGLVRTMESIDAAPNHTDMAVALQETYTLVMEGIAYADQQTGDLSAIRANLTGYGAELERIAQERGITLEKPDPHAPVVAEATPGLSTYANNMFSDELYTSPVPDNDPLAVAMRNRTVAVAAELAVTSQPPRPLADGFAAYLDKFSEDVGGASSITDVVSHYLGFKAGSDTPDTEAGLRTAGDIASHNGAEGSAKLDLNTREGFTAALQYAYLAENSGIHTIADIPADAAVEITRLAETLVPAEVVAEAATGLTGSWVTAGAAVEPLERAAEITPQLTATFSSDMDTAFLAVQMLDSDMMDDRVLDISWSSEISKMNRGMHDARTAFTSANSVTEADPRNQAYVDILQASYRYAAHGQAAMADMIAKGGISTEQQATLTEYRDKYAEQVKALEDIAQRNGITLTPVAEGIPVASLQRNQSADYAPV